MRLRPRRGRLHGGPPIGGFSEPFRTAIRMVIAEDDGLEAAPDLWLAVWLARDDLTLSERKRVGEERARRRAVATVRTVGFTGSRAGMTPAQLEQVRALVRGADEGHHGDCVGADEKFHAV